MRTLIIGAVFALGMTGAADAVCSIKDLDGRWTVQWADGVYCSMALNKSGKVTNSRCLTGQTFTGKLSGFLKTNRSCTVAGTIRQSFKGDRASFRVYGQSANDGTLIAAIASNRAEQFTVQAEKK